jgi:hypothetical protein
VIIEIYFHSRNFMSCTIPIAMLLSGATTLRNVEYTALSDSRGDDDTGEICTKFHNGAKLAIGWDEMEQSAPIMMTSVMVLDELVT